MIPPMVPQLPKAMTTLPRRLTAAILVFLMLAAAITAAAASGTPQALNASLPENSPAGASLGTPMETTAPAGTVSYSLSGPDAGLFDIDPATGEITRSQGASPDFETRASYSVTITAAAQPGRDGGKRRRAGQRLPEHRIAQVRRAPERQPDRPRRQRERPLLELAPLHTGRLGRYTRRNSPRLHPRGRGRGPEAPGRRRL